MNVFGHQLSIPLAKMSCLERIFGSHAQIPE